MADDSPFEANRQLDTIEVPERSKLQVIGVDDNKQIETSPTE